MAATGGSPRHSLVLDTAMRPLMSYLKALTLPIGVYAATEDWADASLQSRIERAGAALAGMLGASAAGGDGAASGTGRSGAGRSGAGRPERTVVDEFTDVPNFEDLLASVQR